MGDSPYPFSSPGGSDTIKVPSPASWWAVVALLVSGIALIVIETADLLFFFGLALTLVGLYLAVRRAIASLR